MSNRKISFEVDHWYHCYNRSIEGRPAFLDLQDYRRFLEILYLANDEEPLRRNDIGIEKFEEIFNIPRSTTLVGLGAFCLMPDHFHLAIKETSPGGLTTFMRKVGTAYTLYFNARHKRMGNLFLKPFQALEVSLDSLPSLIHYVHAVPAVLYEPEWKRNHVVDPEFLEERLLAYPYSSLRAHAGAPVAIGTILDPEALSPGRLPPLHKRLVDARRYAAEIKNFPR